MHFQKWQKINFCSRKKFKTNKNAIFRLFSGAKIDFLPFLKRLIMCFCTFVIALFSNFRALCAAAQQSKLLKSQNLLKSIWFYLNNFKFDFQIGISVYLTDDELKDCTDCYQKDVECKKEIYKSDGTVDDSKYNKRVKGWYFLNFQKSNN